MQLGLLKQSYNNWPDNTIVNITGYTADSGMNGKIRITYICKMPDGSELNINTRYISVMRKKQIQEEKTKCKQCIHAKPCLDANLSNSGSAILCRCKFFKYLKLLNENSCENFKQNN